MIHEQVCSRIGIPAKLQCRSFPNLEYSSANLGVMEITASLDRMLPFPRSYWAVPGKLLAGCYPGSTDPDESHQKVRGLLSCGIQSVINLMEEGETDHSGRPFSPYMCLFREIALEQGLDFHWFRLPIRDGGVPSRSEMASILDRIDEAIGSVRPVYVHCRGGWGRAGTVVGCWLARHGVSEGHNILGVIRRLRRHDPTARDLSPETSAQREFVINRRVGE